MNPAAVHLALNHFPPIIDFAALIVLAIGLIWRNQSVLRVALGLIVLASLIAIPVFLTGEPAEDVVKDLEGVNAPAIHPHEEAAEWAFVLLCAQGVIALATFVILRREDGEGSSAERRGRSFASLRMTRAAFAAVVLVTAVATIAVFRTAKLGGNIHHPETKLAR